MLLKEYQEELNRLLLEHYQLLKKGKPCEERKSYLMGFINAGEVLTVIDSQSTMLLMESLHFEVFGMTISQRRASKKALKEAVRSKDDGYFDIPPSMRGNTLTPKN